jgi:putative tryptophan/tyrosine transport system substrate-binding protein
VRRSRREFLKSLTWTVTGWSGAARAQQAAKIPRVGLLSPFTKSDTVTWHQAFLRGLQALGWIDGKNVLIESRYAEGRNSSWWSI